MKKYKIIDARCHIYLDKIAEKASESTGNFYSIPMCLDGKISTLLEYGEKVGIDHFVSAVCCYNAEAGFKHK